MNQNVVSIERKPHFVQVFNDITIDEKYRDLVNFSLIERIDYFKKSDEIIIYLSSDSLIPVTVVEELENQIQNKFKVAYVEIVIRNEKLKSNLKTLLPGYKDKIIKYLVHKHNLAKLILLNSEWNVTDEGVTIVLQTYGAEFLKTKKCDRLIEEFISRNFDVNYKVQFRESNEVTGNFTDEYIQNKKNMERELILQALNESKPQKDNLTSFEQSSSQKLQVILGKKIKDEVIKIIELNEETDKAVIEGEILTIESKEGRNGKVLISFDIYDRSSSITVKAFVKKNKVNDILSKLKVGQYVKVYGNVQYDKFLKEITFIASDISEQYHEIRMDRAEVKRVELHAHTQMSTMDGTMSVEKMIARASLWGHKAIAVTDHGVVQAYPEAYNAGKTYNVKIIYGVECYLADDKPPIVKSPITYPVDGEFVVIDIETTGLDPFKDRITELAAVKIKDGKVIEKFSSLVNPEIKIPENIVDLTGINDDMVKNAPVITEIFPELLSFIGELPVIAHNASFDMGFIGEVAKRLNMPMKNSVVDLLVLARILLPDLESHKLESLANYFNIESKNFHRGLEDALVAAEIWFRFVEILKKKGIQVLDVLDKRLNNGVNIKNMETFHATILVKNQNGLKNLYRLISESHLNYFYKKPKIPKSLLSKYRDGLLIGTACNKGELFTALLEKRNSKEINRIVKFYDFLEIQPRANNEFLIRSGKIDYQDLIDINKQIVALGEKYNKLVVATGDAHFLDPWDEIFRRILMAGQGYEESDEQAPLYLKTTEEMLEEFEYLGKDKAYEVVVVNPNKIVDMIEDVVPIPQKPFPPKIEGAEEELEKIAWSKAIEIFGEPLPEIVEKRLVKELNSIIKNGFAVMYIIAQKLVQKSLEDGYLVGSRGSVGSSFVATLAGITEVNPLPPHYICKNCKYSEFPNGKYDCGVDMPDKHCPICGNLLHKDGFDIPFETFLGFEGDKEPDIDLNFSGEYQPVAHKYIEELFGSKHVFRAGTIATIGDKTAYGFVKNYLNERNIYASSAEINRLVNGCTGVKRTTGQHPGGVMIIPKGHEVYEFTPIQHPADDQGAGVITTHFDYHAIHGTLFKLDILGHDDPTLIKMLEDLTGINARKIPLDDKETMKIFSSTETLGITPESINCKVGTIGIPEFGTRFVRQMLIDTNPTTFSELIKISGLSHGTDVWLNNAQDLICSGIAKLSEVICTRDDIMLFLIRKGLEPKLAFKIMEDVRKGKGLTEEYIKAMKEHDIPDWYIDSCNKIKYMFPKAHAAAYVIMAFRIAYFKVHYPNAFYAAYFTVKADDFDAELMMNGPDKIKEYIKKLESKGNDLSVKEKNVLTILEVANEMYQRGIKFLPIDLYKSDATRFLLEEDGIRPPLNALQGLGEVAARSIVKAREEGKFLSKDDLRIRAKISKTVMEILDKHGCLKELPESNQLSLF